MAEYTNLYHWLQQPKFEDGDVVRNSMLAVKDGGNCDQGKKIRFINCNLKGRTTTIEQLPEDGNAIGEFADIEPQQIVDTEAAFLAETTLRSLLTSTELSNDDIALVTALCGEVKESVNVNPTLGESATYLTQQLIQRLEIVGLNDKAEKVRQALGYIQTVNGGNI